MRKSCLFLFLAILYLQLPAQTPVIDSLKARLNQASTDEQKIEALGYLSRTLMNVNLAEADKYGQQMIELAEMSRDRKLMIKALLANGERYSYLAGKKENITKATDYYNQALELARKNKLDEQMLSAWLALSEVSRYQPDLEKALSYSNQAYAQIGFIRNDSLTARVHIELGLVYLAKDEKILALKNLMTALRIAEELKNNNLVRASYTRLSAFYASLEDYDKAIDYQVKALDKLNQIKTGQTPYNRVQDLTRIGDLYTARKSYEMAMSFYQKALKLADSLKFEPIKALAHRSIISNYLTAGQPQKALDYFNQNPELKRFLEALNFGYFVDQSYGYIYTQLGKYDSAKYYYNKIAPFFESAANSANQLSYNYQLALLYKKTGEYDKSLEYLLKTNQQAMGIGQLEMMKQVAFDLDTLYQLKGDYKQALTYSSLGNKYKDSLEKLGKEKDLLQIEVTDEQQRQERIAKEKLEAKHRRDNVQYLLITLGISGLFIMLVMLGMFKVSATTIKMIGFFAFLMFFEFIFLIFKKNIYAFTQGEPWKDLLAMIGLAAILLPLHHWLEHKVIHYLTTHNRLTDSGRGLKEKLFGKRTAKEGGKKV